MTQLQKCAGPDVVFKAKTVQTSAMFTRGATETEVKWAVEKMDKNGSYVPELVLRKGSQVMLLTNMDIEHGLVNGSRGVVERFCEGPGPDGKYPMVKFRNGEVIIISPATWASEDVDGLTREQIPLRLAYAITIHKAQGATLDCALIDIGDNTFEYGQAYVALSRVKSLDSLYIWDLKASAFTVHPKVTQFFQSISDQTALKSTAITEFNESTSEPLPE
jgi:ATP-dependent DNA helicase PIF1